MIVVAAASIMMVSVLKSQKDVTASARLNQELGAVMAVMSNEIRRAGFRVCDENDPLLTCKDTDGNPLVSYALGEDITIGQNTTAGDCILYRYNADVDDNPDDPEEYRGFRLNGNIIEMADSTGDVTCGSNDNWVPLTDPTVMKVSAISGFTFFSTEGSKCRNMTKSIYWTVGDDEAELACAADTDLDNRGCIDLNDPAEVATCIIGATTVNPVWVNDTKDTLFGVNQIRINLRAELTRDPAVSKNLKTSVKVANPWIRPGVTP
jgi:type II secretory pathway component PulJ